jgi:hypothetical protein
MNERLIAALREMGRIAERSSNVFLPVSWRRRRAAPRRHDRRTSRRRARLQRKSACTPSIGCAAQRPRAGCRSTSPSVRTCWPSVSRRGAEAATLTYHYRGRPCWRRWQNEQRGSHSLERGRSVIPLSPPSPLRTRARYRRIGAFTRNRVLEASNGRQDSRNHQEASRR